MSLWPPEADVHSLGWCGGGWEGASAEPIRTCQAGGQEGQGFGLSPPFMTSYPCLRCVRIS